MSRDRPLDPKNNQSGNLEDRKLVRREDLKIKQGIRFQGWSDQEDSGILDDNQSVVWGRGV